MRSPTILLCAILCLSALFAGCGNKTPDTAAAAPVTPDRGKEGPEVTVSKEAQARAGIRVEPLAAHALQSELTAYGKLIEDPSKSFVVRAPLAGTLRTTAGKEWPSIGQPLPSGVTIGEIEPRLSPTDRIGLNTQLATARSDLSANAAAVAAAQSAWDRARALNADNKNVADKVVQEAAARLAGEQAREKASQESIRILEASLQSIARSGAIPVNTGNGGDIVEILAHAGETIEQGAPIIRLARFDHLLAQIDIPIGEHLPPNRAAARITPAGSEDQPPLPAEPISIAPAADPGTQGVSLLYRLVHTRPGLRPGAAVTARFTLPKKAEAKTSSEGVLIPRAAVVQQDGRLWAYIQTKDDRFARRPVPQDLATPIGFVASAGFSPGDRIVITGAQSLLSEEFKSQNEADTN